MKRIFPVFLMVILALLACVSEPALPGLVTVEPQVVSTPIPQPGPLSPVPGATPAADTPSSGEAIPMQVGYGYRGPFYEIYFTDPLNLQADNQEGGPDLPLVRAIDQARISVDMAAYSLSLPSVRDALLGAWNCGVQVRLVMETGNVDDTVPT